MRQGPALLGIIDLGQHPLNDPFGFGGLKKWAIRHYRGIMLGLIYGLGFREDCGNCGLWGLKGWSYGQNRGLSSPLSR